MQNRQKLLSLAEKYGGKCKITLIDMQNSWENAYSDKRITTPSYYRLSLSELPELKNLNKIIWLDGDTLIFDDLTEMLNIDMSNLYYRGFLDYNINDFKRFNIKDSEIHICVGVMLVNLEKLRKDNMISTFEKTVKENNEKLRQHDQTLINVTCYKNIASLPPEYGTFDFLNEKGAQKFANIITSKKRYTTDNLIQAFKQPKILHFVNEKPWRRKGARNQDLWLEYAAKTDYFDDIKAYYGVA